VTSDLPAVYRAVGYFEGFNLDRTCLFQDARQVNPSDFTHLHFGFATLTQDYEVQTGNVYSAYEFQSFTQIVGPARILSFGGWAFSTDSDTYMIFRNGVTAANRETMATNMANFIIANNLDGVDIDWEYPGVGAGDIPGIPASSPDDGANFLAFLTLLKSLLPGKTVSIAAPSSYWFLRNYPIQEIAEVIDYIVYMTYDLHGEVSMILQFRYSADIVVTVGCGQF
jgi:GH18 family chitinase